MELDNCPRCGKLFAKNFRDVCPACIKAIDNEYALCADYLRKHRGANITELNAATDVSIKQITKFIKEGRISLVGAPNLMYPCEMCGTLIREHNQCESCRAKLLNEVGRAKMGLSDKDEKDDKEAYHSSGSAASLYRNRNNN
ncbi:flagellar protein [Paenibacillus sp. MWE-103]|uniref:Flagellar protein n=1 Tax=Paenibacillus artemisiicola TaxID=1172618 RepID=A0ABS3WFZ1_9BACL|nr:flagellar protein [Paenibacillus artemisiicola]MBO7747225.1 flagellar protein [Paenibacillus artemisiicola]